MNLIHIVDNLNDEEYIYSNGLTISLEQAAISLVYKLKDTKWSLLQNVEYNICEDKCEIFINEQIVKSNHKVKPGDLVKVMFTHPPYENLLVGEKMSLDIIHEDKNLLVVNKPAGLVVHPGHGNYNGTLLNGLIHHFDNLPQNKDGRPGLVHRIDKDTSGLLVVAKTFVLGSICI